MPFTESFKVALAETDEPISMGNDKTPNLSKFHHLHQAIEVFAFVVEATTNISHPFIDLDGMLVAIRL
jgi:hypothetical protein